MFENFERESFRVKFLKGKTTLKNLQVKDKFLRKILFGWAPTGGNLQSKLHRLASDCSAQVDTLEVECHNNSILNARSHPILLKLGTVRVKIVDSSIVNEPAGVSVHSQESNAPMIFVRCSVCGECLRAPVFADMVICICGEKIRIHPDVVVAKQIRLDCPSCSLSLLTPEVAKEIVCIRCRAIFDVEKCQNEGKCSTGFPKAKLVSHGAPVRTQKDDSQTKQKKSPLFNLARDISDNFKLTINKIVISYVATDPNIQTSEQESGMEHSRSRAEAGAIALEIHLSGIQSYRTDHSWQECGSLMAAKHHERARKLGQKNGQGMHCFFRQVDVNSVGIYINSNDLSHNLREIRDASFGRPTLEKESTGIQIVQPIRLRFRMKAHRTDKALVDGLKDVEWNAECFHPIQVHLEGKVYGLGTFSKVHIVQRDAAYQSTFSKFRHPYDVLDPYKCIQLTNDFVVLLRCWERCQRGWIECLGQFNLYRALSERSTMTKENTTENISKVDVASRKHSSMFEFLIFMCVHSLMKMAFRMDRKQKTRRTLQILNPFKVTLTESNITCC